MKRIRNAASVLVLALACLAVGFFMGRAPLRAGFSLPWSHVRDVRCDAQTYMMLTEGRAADAKRQLSGNLNAQVDDLDWIRRYAPLRFARDDARDLLLQIAEQRSEYELLQRETKGGREVHRILDEVEKSANQDQR